MSDTSTGLVVDDGTVDGKSIGAAEGEVSVTTGGAGDDSTGFSGELTSGLADISELVGEGAGASRAVAGRSSLSIGAGPPVVISAGVDAGICGLTTAVLRWYQ